MKADLTTSASNSRPAAQAIRAVPARQVREPTSQPANAASAATKSAERANESAREQRAAREATAETLRALADKLNVTKASISRKLRFQFDESANTSVIQVFERETDRLIRQIPSEEALERLRRNDDQLAQLIEESA